MCQASSFVCNQCIIWGDQSAPGPCLIPPWIINGRSWIFPVDLMLGANHIPLESN
jgi:hypothetical protein